MAATTTFLVGRYADGPRVAVAPLEYCPPSQSVVRSPDQRERRLRKGTLMAWCTLAALAGTCISRPGGARPSPKSSPSFVDVVPRSRAVIIEFVDATDRRGLRYEDARLALAVLEPL